MGTLVAVAANGVEMKYPKIVSALRKRLADNAYPDMLPGAAKLAAEFSVTPMTANKAINKLVAEGLLRREANKGTFVVRDKKNDRVSALFCEDAFPADGESFARAMDVDATVFNRSWGTHKTYEDYVLATEGLGLIAVHEGIIPCLAEAGKLAPLDDLLDKSQTLDRADFQPETLKAMSWKGKLYALPFAFTPTVMLYNKRIFREFSLPEPEDDWTWDKWISVGRDAVRRAKSKGRKIFAFGLNPGWVNFYMPVLRQFGGGFFDDKGDPMIDRPENVEALTFLAELAQDRELCPSIMETTGAILNDLFQKDHLVAQIGNYKTYSLLKTKVDDPAGVTALPRQRHRSTALPTQGWAVAADAAKTANKNLSRVLEKAFTPAAMAFIHEKCRRIPAYRTGGFAVPEAFIRSLAFAAPSWNSWLRESRTSYESSLRLLLTGIIGAKQAVKEIADCIDAMKQSQKAKRGHDPCERRATGK